MAKETLSQRLRRSETDLRTTLKILQAAEENLRQAQQDNQVLRTQWRQVTDEKVGLSTALGRAEGDLNLARTAHTTVNQNLREATERLSAAESRNIERDAKLEAARGQVTKLQYDLAEEKGKKAGFIEGVNHMAELLVEKALRVYEVVEGGEPLKIPAPAGVVGK